MATIGEARYLLLLTGGAVATRLSLFFVSFYNKDEASYSALVARCLEGAIPYAQAVEMHPPGAELVYALVYALVGRNHIEHVRFVLVLFIIATGWVLNRLVSHLHDEPTGRIAGLLYVLFSAAGEASDVQAANTELFANLPLAGAALCAALALASRSRREAVTLAYAAGLLTGIAGVFRYPAWLAGGAWAIAVVYAGFRGREGFGWSARMLAALAAGFATVLMLEVWTLRAIGAWDAFWLWGWRFNFAYVALEETKWEILAAAVRNTLKVAVYWSALLLCLVPRVRRSAIGWIWLAAALVGVAIGGRFWLHYYVAVLPPLCVVAAPGAARLRHAQTSPRRLRTAAVGLGLAAIVGSVAVAWAWYDINPSLAHRRRGYVAAAAYLRSHSSPADRLFIWGDSPEIYYLADRVMGTRFAYTNFHARKMRGGRAFESDAWTRLMADLRETPPPFIVDTGAGGLDRFEHDPISRYPVLQAFVETRYDRVAEPEGIAIYRRRDQ